MTAGESCLHPEIASLYADHHGWLREWLRRRLGCSHSAADLTHDTFVRLLNRRESISLAEPRAYLATIARGLVADLHRRRSLEHAYLEALATQSAPVAPSPETQAIVLEALISIDRMLDGMKPAVRLAFLMSQLEGLTYREIAGRLGISLRTVNHYMVAALERCYTVIADGP